ncbi:MAG: TetR/AcrR family transcriptional regulator [Methylobacterium sp.]|nr:TetR/AcrR family transcriptional regulator [Methylobacterium sp.]
MPTSMREHILGVAAQLFSSRGINATSVDTIVAEAGIAKVTLYKYFKSKEQLIVEYLRQYDDKLWKRLSEVAKQSDSEPGARLAGLVDASLDWIADEEFKGFAFINATVEFPQLESTVHRTSVEFAQTLRNTLAELAREAGFKKPEALALQLALVIEGAAITETTQRGSGAVEHARELADIIIKSAV